MTAMTEYEYNAGTQTYDDQTYWNDQDEEVPYVNHAPDYFKNLVIPAKVKLDAEGKYDPENGTEYTLTRFYGGYTENSEYANEGVGLVSQSKYEYINNNHGTDFWGKCYGVESIVFPNTYTRIELVSNGWYNLSSITLSNKLTHLPTIGGDSDYSESLDPRVELHVPATVTSISEYTLYGGKIKKIYAPASLRTLFESTAGTDWQGNPYPYVDVDIPVEYE